MDGRGAVHIDVRAAIYFCVQRSISQSSPFSYLIHRSSYVLKGIRFIFAAKNSRCECQTLSSTTLVANLVPHNSDSDSELFCHCWRYSVSCCRFTHLEQSATSRHFSTILTDFLKKRRFFSAAVSRPDFLFRTAADFVFGPAVFGLNALFVN